MSVSIHSVLCSRGRYMLLSKLISNMSRYRIIFVIAMTMVQRVDCSYYKEAMFTRYETPSGGLLDTSISTAWSCLSQPRCILDCLSKDGCQGTLYDPLTNNCRMITCVNPNLLTLQHSDVFKLYVVGGLNRKELARGKPAYLSSTLIQLNVDPNLYIASKANDGVYFNPHDQYGSTAGTELENRPWWRVDLESVFCIWEVNILNTGQTTGPDSDMYKSAKNAEVTVAMETGDLEFTESNREVLCNYHDGILNPNYTLVTCGQPIRGQFVQVLWNATTSLYLFEVEVYGI